MRGTFLAVIFLLGLQFWIQDVAGVQLDHRLPGENCKCRKVTMHPIRKHLIRKIEIIPSRVYCPAMEIIITTKNKQVICADPQAEWLKTTLPRLMQQIEQNEERQAKQVEPENAKK